MDLDEGVFSRKLGAPLTEFGVCLVSIIGEHQRDYRESVRL
jgi:hypothetical protein